MSTKRKKTDKSVLLHRFIMNAPKDRNIFVDHIYHDTFDNRKANLRLATRSGNNQNCEKYSSNKSGVPGVYFWSYHGWEYWRADIHDKDGKRIYLGYHKKFEDAVKARKEAEIRYYGEYRYSASNE